MDRERGKARLPKKVFDKPPAAGHGDVEAGLKAAEVGVEETYITLFTPLHASQSSLSGVATMIALAP